MSDIAVSDLTKAVEDFIAYMKVHYSCGRIDGIELFTSNELRHAFERGASLAAPAWTPAALTVPASEIGDRYYAAWKLANELHARLVAMHGKVCTKDNCVLDGGPEHDQYFAPPGPTEAPS